MKEQCEGISRPFGAFRQNTTSIILLSACVGLAGINSTQAASSGSYQYGAYNYAEVLQKSMYFYDVQRSGDLPDNYRVSWRGDSALEDGSDAGLDLTGGFYDAGDHVKFGFPMAFSFTMLAWGAMEYPEAYTETKQDVYLMAMLRDGMDYLMRCHVRNSNGSTKTFYGQVGNGHWDHAYWGPPETMTMERPSMKIDANNPGTELAAETAASMAAVSILFKDSDPAFSAQLIDHAKALYTFADTYRGMYHKSIKNAEDFYKSWSGYEDELIWGALWLYRATNERAYLNKAKDGFHALGYTLHDRALDWDNKFYGCYILFALLDSDQEFRTASEKWLDHWSAASGGMKRTPDGLSWLQEWGPLRYAANTAFCALLYADKINDPNGKYSAYGKSQIHYMLGDNDLERSFVCGFGVNPPVKPHHRSSHGSTTDDINNPVNSKHVLYGALVGGPDQNGNYADTRPDFKMNEVAMDYNAGFTGAIAALYSKYGGYTLNKISDQTTPKKNEETPVLADLDVVISATDFDGESHPNDENKIRKSTSNIGYIQNGTWVRYDDVHFDTGAGSIEVQAATPNAGGDIEVRINSSTGTRLGTVNVTNTGAWNTYRTFRADLSPTTGTKDLYLVFKGGSGGLMNVKSFRLNSAAAAPSGYTECAREGGTVTFDTIVDVAYGANGNYVYLDNVTGPVYFHNSIFGDPIPGVAKKGYDRPAQGGTTGKAYSWNNGEEATDFKQVSHSVNNGILSMTLETADNDPYVRMKNADINGNTYTHIRLKIRNNTSGTAWKMYFKPEGGGEGGNSIGFAVPADNAWHTYVLKMDTDPDWKGTISSIRLDPQGSVSGSVDVDYVNIISAP